MIASFDTGTALVVLAIVCAAILFLLVAAVLWIVLMGVWSVFKTLGDRR